MVSVSARCGPTLGLVLVTTAVSASCGTSPAQPADEPAETPSPVVVAKDQNYAVPVSSGLLERALDVYAPREASGGPAVVVLHGASGAKDQFSFVEFSRRLAAAGMVVFTADYLSGTSLTLVRNNGRQFREVLENAVCAVRFARARAAGYGGDPSRVIVIGQSAGGLFGGLAAFLGDGATTLWDSFAEERGGPQQQMGCVAAASASVHGLVGFNGAFFVLADDTLEDDDPELWKLTDVRGFTDRNPGLRVRFILGTDDTITPAWHTDMVKAFSASLRAAGFDADWTEVPTNHFFGFGDAAWSATLATILEVVSG